jgi:hypothetical protein
MEVPETVVSGETFWDRPLGRTVAHRPQRNGAHSEEIHLPAPSLVPLFTAIGLTVALLGLILSWWFVVAGGVVAVIAIALWIRDVRRDIESLPAERH